MIKYPRTAHMEGSRHGYGDDLADVTFADLTSSAADAVVVVEEKLDGSNSAISFDPDGTLRLQSRGHYLAGGPRERHFAELKSWAAVHQGVLRDRLSDRYVCYGEWMAAKHTVFYDRLPHLFLEFDIFDRVEQCWLDTPRRRELLADSPVVSVPVLARSEFNSLTQMTSLLGPSLYKSAAWIESFEEAVVAADADLAMSWTQTDRSDLAEGLYVKVERDGVVVQRLKWVRPGFVQSLVAGDSHWLSRPLVQNRLAPGVDIYEA